MSLRHPPADHGLPRQLVCLTCRFMVLLIIASLGLMLALFASGHDAWVVAAAVTAAATLALASGIVSGAEFYDRRHHRTRHSA